jgi:hypothetical protein
MKTFMKFYLPFRAFIIMMGSLPGMLFFWPMTIFLISLAPKEVSGIFAAGYDFLVRDVILFGHADEYRALEFGFIFLLPTILALLLILIENISGFFLCVEKAQEGRY